MDRKAKSRYKEYVQYCQDNLRANVIKLEVPNETRVSGVFLMYELAMKSKRTLNFYCNSKATIYRDLILTDREWMQMAETLSVLKNVIY
jgi:hypothetical protein